MHTMVPVTYDVSMVCAAEEELAEHARRLDGSIPPTLFIGSQRPEHRGLPRPPAGQWQ